MFQEQLLINYSVVLAWLYILTWKPRNVSPAWCLITAEMIDIEDPP